MQHVSNIQSTGPCTRKPDGPVKFWTPSNPTDQPIWLISTPHQHLITQFSQAGCPYRCPTNSVKALKATNDESYNKGFQSDKTVQHSGYTSIAEEQIKPWGHIHSARKMNSRNGNTPANFIHCLNLHGTWPLHLLTKRDVVNRFYWSTNLSTHLQPGRYRRIQPAKQHLLVCVHRRSHSFQWVGHRPTLPGPLPACIKQTFPVTTSAPDSLQSSNQSFLTHTLTCTIF